ncbi:MAG: hypothetical protein IH950_16345 [Bacteroidetes bacterium]|nr:hypothetical protein [Bacteroidota bacterium]
MTTLANAIYRSSQLGVTYCLDWQTLRDLTSRDFPGQENAVERYLLSLQPCSYSLPAASPFLDFRYPTEKEYFDNRSPVEKEIANVKEVLSVDKNKLMTRKFVLPVVLSAIAYFLFFG